MKIDIQGWVLYRSNDPTSGQWRYERFTIDVPAIGQLSDSILSNYAVSQLHNSLIHAQGMTAPFPDRLFIDQWILRGDKTE